MGGGCTTAIANWKRQFLQAGLNGLAGDTPRVSEREARLAAENEALKKALREAAVLGRIWKMSAQHRAAPGDRND